MKKVIFIGLVVLYIVAGLYGQWTNAYIDEGTKLTSIDRFFLPLTLVSLLVGVLFFLFFLRTFPKGYAIQSIPGRLVIPVIFILLVFAINMKMLITLNCSLGRQQKLMIGGYVLSEYFEKAYNDSKIYYLTLNDTISNRKYKFRVKKQVYNQSAKEGDVFNKEFTMGSLGIIYRKDI